MSNSTTSPITQTRGSGGVHPWSIRPDYKSYKSPFGPSYKFQPNYHGIGLIRATRFGITAGAFGAVAGTFAVFFFAEIPRFSRDVMQRVPILGSYFVKEIPPEDNPF